MQSYKSGYWSNGQRLFIKQCFIRINDTSAPYIKDKDKYGIRFIDMIWFYKKIERLKEQIAYWKIKISVSNLFDAVYFWFEWMNDDEIEPIIKNI